MKKKLLVTTAMRGLARLANERYNQPFQHYRGTELARSGRLAVAGFLSLGLGLGIDQAIAADKPTGDKLKKFITVKSADSKTSNNAKPAAADKIIILSRYNKNSSINDIKKNWYVKPSLEAIFSSGQFDINNKMNVGLGGSIIAGYHYAPPSWSPQAGQFGFEVGLGFFAPRLDSGGGETFTSDGVVGFGAAINKQQVDHSVVSDSFVSGVAQSTTANHAGLQFINNGRGVTVTIVQGVTDSVLDGTLHANVGNSQDARFATAAGKAIGTSNTEYISNFEDHRETKRIIVGTTSSVTFGISQLPSVVYRPLMGNIAYANGGGMLDINNPSVPFVMAVDSVGVVVITRTEMGGMASVLNNVNGFGIVSYTPVLGYLSGTPTLQVSGKTVQEIKTNSQDSVEVVTRFQTRAQAVDITSGYNVSETANLRAELVKTETRSSNNITETSVIQYDRVLEHTTRIVTDNKETYVPITIGANYSLPMGKSGFGFTAGVDVGAWIHNINRGYYFSGGGGQNFTFTETAVSNYVNTKSVFDYSMSSAVMDISHDAREVVNRFIRYSEAAISISRMGSVSLTGEVALDSKLTFRYDDSTTYPLLLGYDTGNGVRTGGPFSGRLPAVISKAPATMVTPTGGRIAGNKTSFLHNLAITNVSMAGALYGAYLVIPTADATPTMTIVNSGTTATRITTDLFTKTSTFVASTAATSRILYAGVGVATSTVAIVVTNVSAVITSQVTVAVGQNVSTLFGNSVTIDNNSFTTTTEAVKHLVDQNTSITSQLNGVALGQTGDLKQDQATQVKGIIIPKVSFNWSPLDNLMFTLGGKMYIVIGGYSDYYSAAARAEATAQGIGYKKDQLLWYGGLDIGAQFSF